MLQPWDGTNHDIRAEPVIACGVNVQVCMHVEEPQTCVEFRNSGKNKPVNAVVVCKGVRIGCNEPVGYGG